MSNKTITTLALSLVALAASAVPSQAAEEDILKVSVPFAFRVGATTLPAGNYRVFRENEAGLVRIAGASGSIMLITHPGALVTGNGEPALAFHKTGGVAVLEQLRMAGDAAEIIPGSNAR